MKYKIVVIVLQMFSITAQAMPEAPKMATEEQDQMLPVLKQELLKIYPGAKIDLSGDYRWVRGAAPKQVQSVMIYGDDGKGNLHFAVQGEGSLSSEGWVPFAAWVSAKMPIKRVSPGEKLRAEFFRSALVNVAAGPAHEYRGILFDDAADVTGFENIQTLLEGQVLTLSAVRRVPDIRRGDTVQIQLRSAGLVLTTQGFAGEPGYRNSPVRAVTQKTKREVTGVLRAGSVVEVQL